METFSALLALCEADRPITGGFPSQRPVTQSFDVIFDLHLNKRLSKQLRRWWFETPSRSFWCHRNEQNRLTHLSVYPRNTFVYARRRCHNCRMLLMDYHLIIIKPKYISGVNITFWPHKSPQYKHWLVNTTQRTMRKSGSCLYTLLHPNARSRSVPGTRFWPEGMDLSVNYGRF